MNKQELIKKYVYMKRNLEMWVSIPDILEDLKQLDEPQKVQVPQYVADWYEKHKSNLEYELWNYIRDWEDQKPSEFKRWFDKSNNAFRTIVNMHQFGYEVKKEKRYLVKVKGMDKEFTMLKLDKIKSSWYLGNDTEYSYTKTTHTREELEQAGFGWVFGCPGMEVEEVEG